MTPPPSPPPSPPATPPSTLLRAFTRAPLRLRLASLLTLCAGMTAAFGVAAVVSAWVWFEPDRIRAEADELAATLAYALEVPLTFEDGKAAGEVLAMLRARSDIRWAIAYDAQDRQVARYDAGVVAADLRRWSTLPGAELVIEHSIGTGGQRIGRLVLQESLAHVYRHLLLLLGAILGGTALGLAAALTISRGVARRITAPVSALADASMAIAHHKDYSRRLDGAGDDEVGLAVVAFNRMLDELHARDASLEATLATLENRVVARTNELRREKERAESASRAKTSFLANMSHELRTPLNAVIGAAQLLQDSGEKSDQMHLIDIVRNSGTELLGLIENVLDVSRIEAGELPVILDDFNLPDCLEAAIATASVAARAKGLTICAIVDPALPVWRRGDAIRLRQVVLNILGNAVKFTLRGEVVLQASPGAAPGAVRISVRDSGIGIAADKQADIFEPFRQADDATTRRFGGTGLGLAISRRLVRAMGGDISVSSEPGRGSEFSFEIVLADPSATFAAAHPAAHDVLYYEPHAPSAEALAALLARCGCHARRIVSAAELAAWGAAGSAPSPRELPWLLVATESAAGTEVIAAAQRWIAARRLVEMNGLRSVSDSPASRRFGLHRGLLKPVLRGALVSRLGAGRISPAVMEQSPSGSADERNRVLVVEDDSTNQLIVGSMLRNAGYDVLIANDGGHALTLLRRHVFDVVLMDWQMPDMDGLAATRLIRAGAVGRYGAHVPIIALTANAFSEDRTACLAAGMNDFLTKPVLVADLLAMVERWARNGETRGPTTRPAVL